MRHAPPTPTAPDPALLRDASAAYAGFLVEEYGFEPDEVALPEIYAGRELDWFGHLNEVLTQLEEYSHAEALRILRGRNPWVREGGTLLGRLREGQFADVHRILNRY